MAYQIFRLLFVRTTGTDLQHDLQHGLQHNRKKLKFHRLFELSVQSIIGAQDIRQGTIFCDFLSIADIYRSTHNPARASFQSVSFPSVPILGQVTTKVVTWPPCCNSPRPSPFLGGDVAQGGRSDLPPFVRDSPNSLSAGLCRHFVLALRYCSSYTRLQKSVPYLAANLVRTAIRKSHYGPRFDSSQSLQDHQLDRVGDQSKCDDTGEPEACEPKQTGGELGLLHQ